MEAQRLLTITDAATYLGVSRNTLYAMIEKGQIKRIPVSDTYRISKKELDEYLENSRV